MNDFAIKAKRTSDIDGQMLVLKALANVGHVIIEKPIMKTFAALISSPDSLHPCAAILALRGLVEKYPARVRRHGIFVGILWGFFHNIIELLGISFFLMLIDHGDTLFLKDQLH